MQSERMVMSQDNISILQETLEVLNKGFYKINGKTIFLKLTRSQMEEAKVFFPRDVAAVSKNKNFKHIHKTGRCVYACENMDAFSLARKRISLLSEVDMRKGKTILVLNLANPLHPGGGVRRGAKAQEEDLCRKSSLLLSLESRDARPYYEYNRALNTYMGSDAVMIHPQVEIIRDEKDVLLEDSVIVAVMTCAAPMLWNGMEGMSEKQYEDLMLGRITGMLKVAAYLGYEHLVLGAFGCGAFRNDAKIVSDLFYKVLRRFDYGGMKEKNMFRRIDFAVPDHTADQYNFKEFSRNFAHCCRDEDQTETEQAPDRMKKTDQAPDRRKKTDWALVRRKKTEIHLDAIRGCIYGGAVGDALGYPVEFLDEKTIFSKYGPQGITAYEKDPDSGKALISDDTQMALFTANGLLVRDTSGAMRGIRAWPRACVEKAYQDWLLTQDSTYEEVNRHERCTKDGGFSWLLDVPELYSRRAPGNTCLSALREGTVYYDYVKAHRNNSKGCGGIMRIAPLAVKEGSSNISLLDQEAAQISAITHGHPLGYLPSVILVHMIYHYIYRSDSPASLKEVILDALNTVQELYRGEKYLTELTDIVLKAIDLAENGAEKDLDNIHQLGEGWVAEETLGISLYCALRHQDDFSAGVIAAVNHRGDSDSTGAVTGNILGAMLGYQAIEEKWKKDLELSDIILEMADDLCHGCQIYKHGHYRDPEWEAKYLNMHRPV